VSEQAKQPVTEGEISEGTVNTKQNKYDIRNYARIGLTVFITFVCCILFFFIILRFQGFADGWNSVMHAAQPIIIGLVLAYLLNPVMHFWEKQIYALLIKKKNCNERKMKKLARGIAVAGAVLFLLVIIALLIAAIVPSLVSSISTLAVTLPGQVQSFLKMLDEGNLGESQAAQVMATALTSLTDYVESWVKDTLLPEIQTYAVEVTTGVISVVKWIVNFFIGIIVAVYVMMIQETLQGQAKKIVYAVFKPRYGNIIIDTVHKSSEIFGGFISGKLLDSAIIGVICYVVCLILHMPSAMLVSVMIGVTNIIPFFGPIIGAIPSLLLVVIQSPLHALYLLIFIIILQQVDGNIIGPRILGNSTGLSSFWVMFAILVFGGIWGFFGMLLGVPIFAVIYYIIGKVVSYGLRKRRLPDATSEYIKACGVNEDTNTLRYRIEDEPEETEETK
jgi:predicted PurR-regulated permease PerM